MSFCFKDYLFGSLAIYRLTWFWRLSCTHCLYMDNSFLSGVCFANLSRHARVDHFTPMLIRSPMQKLYRPAQSHLPAFALFPYKKYLFNSCSVLSSRSFILSSLVSLIHFIGDQHPIVHQIIGLCALTLPVSIATHRCGEVERINIPPFWINVLPSITEVHFIHSLIRSMCYQNQP